MAFVHEDPRVTYKRGDVMTGDYGKATFVKRADGWGLLEVEMENGEKYETLWADDALELIDNNNASKFCHRLL